MVAFDDADFDVFNGEGVLVAPVGVVFDAVEEGDVAANNVDGDIVVILERELHLADLGDIIINAKSSLSILDERRIPRLLQVVVSPPFPFLLELTMTVLALQRADLGDKSSDGNESSFSSSKSSKLLVGWTR